MDEILQKTKKLLINTGKRMIKIILPIVIIVVIIISAAVYVIKKDDGTYKEGDWSNTQFAAGQFIGNTSIGYDGKISTSMSAQELWDKLIEEDSRVSVYLDGPEELLKLMNAEIVTNYPDLRPNPDEEIDWDAINSNIDSKDAQGIIKFKRAQSNGTTSTMSYVDSDTFYNWIELYCATGDETARQNALTHFTIEKNMATGTGATDNLEYNGKDIVTDISERIIAAAQITPWPGASLCQAWVRAVYANAGLGDVAYAKAVDAYRANVVSTEMDNIPIGAAVYGTGTGAYGAGHVGIYIGNGQVMDSVSSGIRTQSLEEWVAWQESYGFTVDGRTGWLGWGWQSGSPTKIISGGDENAEDKDDEENDDEVSTIDMQLITDNGRVTFYNGDGSAMEGGKLNAIGYELSDGQVAMKDLQQYKNCVIYIETAENGEGSYANGKFFYVTDTGGGLADNQVDVYADVDQSTLNAAPYGSYTSGAKIYLVESNVTLDDYNSKYLDKEIGEVDSGTTQNQNAYSVVVATWSKTQVIVESDDPQVEESNNTTLSMTTQKINYQDFVSGYTMPFDYLWDLLVLTEDKDFVFNLADLVYDSEIEITIHDNENVHTKKDIYNYTRKEKVQTTNVTGSITYHSNNTSGAATSQGSQVKTFTKSSGFEPVEYPYPYKTTKTTITTTNTLDISLTKADVWIVKYEKKYEYQGQQLGTEQSGGAQALDNVDYGAPEVIHTDRNGDGAATLQSEQSALISQGNTIVSSNVNTTCNVWHGVFDITEEITNKTDTTKYISSPATIEEKTDKNATEPNFVTILLDDDNLQAQRYLIDASSWLFDILAGNEKTADMVDLTKYLLYKALGIDSGVTEFDFSIYDPKNFVSIDGDYGDWDGTGSQEDFIRAIAPYAVIDMQQHQIYASVTIAQAIIESGWGKDNIAIQYKNFFGMKGGGAGPNEYWSGEVVNLNASEGGVSGFRVYDSLKNSVYDHGRNFHVTSTYAAHGVLDCIPQNLGPKEQLRRIAISGYAVYADGSISKPDGVRTYDVYLYEEFIQKYNLEQYDSMSPEDFEQVGGNSEIVDIAKSKLGCPYVWGATGPDTFDCSGLVQWVYAQAGISVPRTTYDYEPYLGTSKEISWSEAQPGDIVWNDHHMGIYLGNDEFIHAPQTGDVVKISSGASGRFTNVFRFTN